MQDSPHPRRRGKRVDTYGFYPLNSRFPLFLSLAQTGDRRPLRKKGTAEFFSSAWTRLARHVSAYSQSQIPYCYTGRLLSASATQGELPVCVAVRYL